MSVIVTMMMVVLLVGVLVVMVMMMWVITCMNFYIHSVIFIIIINPYVAQLITLTNGNQLLFLWFCDITVSFNSSSRAVLDSESASIIPMNELPSFFNRSSANEDNPLDNWSSNPPEATISGKFCALFNVARFEKIYPYSKHGKFLL